MLVRLRGDILSAAEINEELLNNGLASISSSLTKSVEKGKISQQDKDATFDCIRGTTNINNFSDCHVVIEAVTENIDLKKKAFAEPDTVCPEHSVLATNMDGKDSYCRLAPTQDW